MSAHAKTTELGLPTPAYIFWPFCRPVPPSPSQSCQPAALQRTHLSTSVTAHTKHLQHRGTRCTHVPCTSHIPAGHCALFDELPPNATAAWPNDCKMRCTYRACLSLRSKGSRLFRIGTEMTYSNICDPARPPVESQRSITSQILIPRKGREREKNALTQLTNPLLRYLCYRAVYSVVFLYL